MVDMEWVNEICCLMKKREETEEVCVNVKGSLTRGWD